MGPFDSVTQGLQNFSQGSSPAANMVGFGLSLFGQNAGQAQDAAVRDGMNQLAGHMQETGGDPARSMMKFVQSPEGQKLMATPGAFKALTSAFTKNFTNPPPVATQAGPGTDVTQNGQSLPLQGRPGYTAPNPQQQLTPPGNASTSIQQRPGGGSTSNTTSQLPTDMQSLEHVIQNFGHGLTPDGLSQLALSTQAQTPFAQANLAVQGLVASKQITPQEAQMALSGQYSILQDKEIPGRFYIQDKFHPENIKMMQLGGFSRANGSGDGGNGTLVPNWATGNMSSPQSMSSTPQKGQTFNGPQAAGSNVPGQQQQPSQATPQMQQTATKYKVPVESVQSDGTINPVSAWGPGVLPILGAGLPAIIQNKAGIVSRWFDPSNTEQSSGVVAQAEIAGDALQVLLGGMASGNSRVKIMIQNLLEMGPEHEKWNDPQYATDQLIQMRQTFEGMAQTNGTQIAQLKQEGIKADNEQVSKYAEQNTAIEKVLRFLPSTEGLMQMKEAIRDGKVRVPSIAGATSTVGKVTSQAVKSGASVLFGEGNADKLNGDAASTISKIGQASPKDLKSLAREYPRLNPAIQRALDARLQELRSPGKPNAATQATPYSSEQPQGGTAQQFVKNPENPMQTASNPFEIAKQSARTQRSNMPFGGKNPTSNQRVKGAFSQFGM
jgi:hypothetical protein